MLYTHLYILSLSYSTSSPRETETLLFRQTTQQCKARPSLSSFPKCGVDSACTKEHDSAPHIAARCPASTLRPSPLATKYFLYQPTFQISVRLGICCRRFVGRDIATCSSSRAPSTEDLSRYPVHRHNRIDACRGSGRTCVGGAQIEGWYQHGLSSTHC
jgi:hypothetical protein